MFAKLKNTAPWLLLCLMVISLFWLPSPASAADTTSMYGGTITDATETGPAYTQTESGETITITAEGTYTLSGSFSGSRIIINLGTGSSGTVTLILANAQIGDGLVVNSAGTVTLSLQDGSVNTLSGDGTVIDISSNLVITGNGGLTIRGDSVDVDGNFTMKSGSVFANVEDGIISGGNFSINSGELVCSGKLASNGGSGGIQITGGTVFSAGGELTNDSTQHALIASSDRRMTGIIVLTDSDKNVLLAVELPASIRTYFFSCPSLDEDSEDVCRLFVNCTVTGSKGYTGLYSGVTSFTGTEQTLDGHVWGEGMVEVEPTCTEEGTMIYFCEICGISYRETINKMGHEWDEGVVIKESDCGNDGIILYTCLAGGETKKETIPATGDHVWGEAMAMDDGESQMKICEVCGEVLIEDLTDEVAEKYGINTGDEENQEEIEETVEETEVENTSRGALKTAVLIVYAVVIVGSIVGAVFYVRKHRRGY